MIKKVFIIALLLFSGEKICALPIGNPSEPSLFFHEMNKRYSDPYIFSFDKVNLIVGYYGDFVFNRHLETVTGRKIDYAQIDTNAGYFALNFLEAVEIFTTLGATKFKFNTSLGPFNAANPSPRFDFETTSAFSWSVGGRAILWEWRCLTLGVEGQYFTANPKPKALFIRTNVNDYPDQNTKRKYSEWQLGAGVSYRCSYYFVPYLAVKYARAFWEFDHQTFLVTNTLATLPNVRSGKNWGYALGATFAPFTCKKIAVTVEGRFADEAALYINGQIRY